MVGASKTLYVNPSLFVGEGWGEGLARETKRTAPSLSTIRCAEWEKLKSLGLRKLSPYPGPFPRLSEK